MAELKITTSLPLGKIAVRIGVRLLTQVAVRALREAAEKRRPAHTPEGVVLDPRMEVKV
jgi:hypothetical protein